MKGPSLPVQIARSINTQPLFAGAFLSELYAERKLKISNTKVGSSPLYYLEGQEIQLEQFIEHLQQKEKEAFLLLKQEAILDDEAQTPVMRVALRAIKDFAVPIRIRINGESRLAWKYFALTDSATKEIIRQKFAPSTPEASQSMPDKEFTLPPTSQLKQKETGAIQTTIKPLDDTKLKTKKKPARKEQKDKIKKEETLLSKKVVEYLKKKDIEILGTILDKRKEFTAKVRIDMLFGKQEFLLMAKDKKKLSENDLIVTMQGAQNARLPALFLSNGELNKKAEDYLKLWSALLKFEKIS